MWSMVGGAFRRDRANESAQASLWMLMLVVVTVLSLTAMARWAASTIAAAHVEATADVVALAGVVGGEVEARSVARRNRTTVTRFVRVGDRVEVIVAADGLSARAAAVPSQLRR